MNSILDVLLVGAGPANLSVLSYMDEAGILNKGYNIRLVEKRENASWHPGLSLPTSTLQVSLLKDLAFLRNPTSPYTFFNFLKEEGLLYQFMHLNTYYPSRNLFSNYLEWIASKLNKFIHYNYEVCKLKRLPVANGKDILEITLKNSLGEIETIKARQLVLSQGHKAFIPEVLSSKNKHVLHSNEFLNKVPLDTLSDDSHIVIVGRGQSSGEIIRFLLERTKVGKVSVISRDFIFKSTDANPFVNDIYTYPRAVDFFNCDNSLRQNMLSGLCNTNYATVTDDVLSAIYEQTFSDRIDKRQRLYLYPYSSVNNLEEKNNKVTINIEQCEPKKNLINITADLIICATGFENTLHKSLLNSLNPKKYNEDLIVNGDFSVQFCTPSSPDVFILNHSRAQHGPTEHTLAGVSERGKVIGDAIIKNISYWEKEIHTKQNHPIAFQNKELKIGTI
ncbi:MULTISPECIES: SidA/IucD/PvdA family monooxygenase [unclassified Pantoea]|uniref:SidA/IucD/PvdA family monooxygenase n=1 Tax=unclassified Pantoea TaxID=2630326 RepID=UPI00301BB93C